MSLNLVRPYFRARLNALGYKEWSDGFNFDNIPENIIDKSYHLDANQITNTQLNHNDLEVSHTVVTRVWFKGFKTVKEALDRTMERIDDIMVEVLKPTNRVTGTGGLRNVTLDNVVIEPLADSNDNTIRVSLTWDVRVYVCLTD